MSTKFKQTITNDLFDAWNNAKRTGDATKIAKAINSCYPVVQRALKYGHVNNDEVKNGINSFFQKRKIEEDEAATAIIG